MTRGHPEGALVAPTGRHGLPADVVAAYQRERILDATTQVVAKRGYQGTSVDQIVRAARVGYVAFYGLFDGKEDCLLAAFERIVTETREQLAASVSSELPWPEQICAALKTLVETIAADPARARFALVEVQASGPAAFARYEAAIDRAVPKLREGRILKPGAAALSETLEEAIIGGVAWIFHQRLVKAKAKELEALLPSAIRIVLSPYLGEADAEKTASEFATQRV